MNDAAAPVVRFWNLGPGRAPERAARCGQGTLPTRAFRYCEALTTATGFGWHVYPALAIELIWDGEAVFWTCDAFEGAWDRLQVAQLPHFDAQFDAAAPPALRGQAPPFLASFPEPGVVQLWTGLFAHLRPGWGLLIRRPANLALPAGCDLYEGMLETESWFGPLFTNIRFTRTDVPVRLDPDRPLLQVQPIPQVAYADATLDGFQVKAGLAELGAEDWSRYAATLAASGRTGRYAADVRRRRRGAAGGCPHHQAMAGPDALSAA